MEVLEEEELASLQRRSPLQTERKKTPTHFTNTFYHNYSIITTYYDFIQYLTNMSCIATKQYLHQILPIIWWKIDRNLVAFHAFPSKAVHCCSLSNFFVWPQLLPRHFSVGGWGTRRTSRSVAMRSCWRFWDGQYNMMWQDDTRRMTLATTWATRALRFLYNADISHRLTVIIAFLWSVNFSFSQDEMHGRHHIWFYF